MSTPNEETLWERGKRAKPGECIPVTFEELSPGVFVSKPVPESAPVPQRTGWVCPLCGQVNAPDVTQCPCRAGLTPQPYVSQPHYPWPLYPWAYPYRPSTTGYPDWKLGLTWV